ncbi:hypothetical protein C8F01DRAFT_1153047 [Mycena amicta]|nr:hypothetical protein C8F01DRAFT_1153047 [Mycena amicta]
MEPRIPSEISDMIIDHLHDDVSALRQCALVCKEWLPAARLHIFSVVHLSLYSIDQMLQVVFYPGSPIPQYIRDLYIIDGQGREADPKWVTRKLPLVPLSSMTCISSLSLEQVDISNLSSAAMAALRGVTARVARLELTYVHFKDRNRSVSLKSLTSCVTRFDRDYTENWSPRPLELESLNDPLLHLICSTNPPPRIRAVSLFLGHLGTSLTHLHIKSFPFNRTPSCVFFHTSSGLVYSLVSDMNAEDIDLSKNPNLKSIVFEPNSSPWIVKVLDTAAPTLEHVYMQLPSDFSDLGVLGRIFMLESSPSAAKIIRWREDSTDQPERIQVRDHEISLRDFRLEYM